MIKRMKVFVYWKSYFPKHGKKVNSMKKEIFESWWEEGFKIGRKKSLEIISKRMIGLNFSFEEIYRITGLSIERIEELL